MKIKPLGFYVLIETVVVEEKTAGGILLDRGQVDKEQEATSIGYVRAIGPTAYAGYPGCDQTVVGKQDAHGREVEVPPHECWGLGIGQMIEYRKFEGKKSAKKGYENYRYIPDSHIIGAIEDE